MTATNTTANTTTNPPTEEDYRHLEPWERLRAGDEVLLPGSTDWAPVVLSGQAAWITSDAVMVRRKIAADLWLGFAPVRGWRPVAPDERVLPSDRYFLFQSLERDLPYWRRCSTFEQHPLNVTVSVATARAEMGFLQWRDAEKDLDRRRIAGKALIIRKVHEAWQGLEPAPGFKVLPPGDTSQLEGDLRLSGWPLPPRVELRLRRLNPAPTHTIPSGRLSTSNARSNPPQADVPTTRQTPPDPITRRLLNAGWSTKFRELPQLDLHSFPAMLKLLDYCACEECGKPEWKHTQLEAMVCGLEEDLYAKYRNADEEAVKAQAPRVRPDRPSLAEAVDLQAPPTPPLPVDDPSGDDVAEDLSPADLRALRASGVEG